MGFLTVETMTIMGLIISELITSEPNKALLRLKDCSLRISGSGMACMAADRNLLFCLDRAEGW